MMRIGAWRGNLVWVGKGRNRGRGRADELEYDLRTRAIVRRSEDRGRKSDSSAARFSLLANLSPIVLVLEPSNSYSESVMCHCLLSRASGPLLSQVAALSALTCWTSRLRNRPTSVTTPTLSMEPRSASFVTTAGLISTQTSRTPAGVMLPTPML
jgi:hypothetical protein